MFKVIDLDFVKEAVNAAHDIDLTDGQAKAILDAVLPKVNGLDIDPIETLIDASLYGTQDVYITCSDCGGESDELEREGTDCPCNRGTLKLAVRRDDGGDICGRCKLPRREHPVKLLSGTYGVNGHRFFIRPSEIVNAWAVQSVLRSVK